MHFAGSTGHRSTYIINVKSERFDHQLSPEEKEVLLNSVIDYCTNVKADNLRFDTRSPNL